MDDDLTRRLRALGTQAVPPGTSASHLAEMAAVGAPPGRGRFGRLAVGLAALAGFLVGGSGLTMAGALPGPAQDVAAGVLAQVGVQAPRSSGAEFGKCVSAAARAKGDDAVGAEDEEADNSAFKAAKAACGEPGGGRGPGREDGRGPQSTPGALDGDPCTGPPLWAGRGTGPTDAERAERDAARSGCPVDVVDAGDLADDGERGRPEGAGRPGRGGGPDGPGGPGAEGQAPGGDGPGATEEDVPPPAGEPVEPAPPAAPDGAGEGLDADGATVGGDPSTDP